MAYGSVLTDVVQSSTAATAPTFKDGNGTEVGTLCRAWVNFSAASGTITVAASFNVTSVTRSAAGQYTVALTNAMPDTKYAATASCHNSTSGTPAFSFNCYAAVAVPSTTTQVNVTGYTTLSNGYVDLDQYSVAIFR